MIGRDIYDRILSYRNDPIGFGVDCLSLRPEYVWDKMREVAEAVRDHQLVAVRAGHSVSKALCVDTPILTKRGMIPISSVKSGDVVYGEYGQEVVVLGRSRITLRPCYRVELDDRSTITACDEHLWRVHGYLDRKSIRRQRGKYQESWDRTAVVTTKAMAENITHNHQTMWSIPVALSFRGRKRLKHAYTIGYWLGDGTRGTGAITIGNKDAKSILDRIKRDGFESSRQPSQEQPGCNYYTIRGLRPILRKYGILYDKCFPVEWVHLNNSDRIDLLRGYLDADGYRLGHGASAALGTTDKRLYDSAVLLLSSLGVKVFCSTEMITYKGDPKTVYKFNISPEWQPFRLSRKQISVSKNRYRHDARMVLSVNPVGMQKVCCIETDNPSGLFLAGEKLIPTHNTFTVGRVIVPWFKVCFQPSTVVTTAPGDNQVRNQLWREIHASYSGASVPLGGKITTLQWDIKPNSDVLKVMSPEDRGNWMKNFAIGFSTSPDSTAEHATRMQGWHNEWFLAVVDEACGIAPQIWRTIVEGLLVDEQCKMLAIGNPTDPDCDFAKSCYSSDKDKNEGSEPYTSDLGFHVITIAATDTPNYKQNRRVIPGLASRSYVERIIRKYGPDGDGTRYRIKGLFPLSKEGTYWGRLIAAMVTEGRFGEYPYDATAKVHTFSDFGDMYTGTLFVQFIRDRVRVIDDYWDQEGQGAPAWARVLQSKPYVYGDHFAGPDLDGSNRTSFSSGKAVKDTLAELGFDVQSVIPHRFDDGIEAVRAVLPMVDMNKRCETTKRSLGGYGKKKNLALSTDDHVVYHDQPAKTWHRHLADACRHLCIAYRYMSIDDRYIGDVDALTHAYEERVEYDPMGSKAIMGFGRL